ncbi:hypothetical protein [Actinoallomurus sp. CA-150999]|uniref:hypothetical protein n=1 Tax=Actinoallomurus sp. CA-150999 TaxID=3239887 RepID=UPI003D90EB99
MERATSVPSWLRLEDDDPPPWGLPDEDALVMARGDVAETLLPALPGQLIHSARTVVPRPAGP